MKQQKMLSHFERMNLKEPHIEVERKPRRYLSEETVFDERSKRYIRKTKYVTCDRQKEMCNFRVSDFTMDNLQAIGAKLNPTIMHASDDMRNNGMLEYIQSVDSAMAASEKTE